MSTARWMTGNMWVASAWMVVVMGLPAVAVVVDPLAVGGVVAGVDTLAVEGVAPP